MWRTTLLFLFLGPVLYSQNQDVRKKLSLELNQILNQSSQPVAKVPKHVKQLIQAKTSRQLELLIPLFQHESLDKTPVLLTAGQIGDSRALEWIKPYLADPQYQAMALFACGECGGALEDPPLSAFEMLLKVTVKPGNENRWFEALSKVLPAEPSDEALQTIHNIWLKWPLKTREHSLWYAWRFKDKRYNDFALKVLGGDTLSHSAVYCAFRSKLTLSRELYIQLVNQLISNDPNKLKVLLQCQTEPLSRTDLPLRVLQNHPDWRVRVQTIKLLAKQGLLSTADLFHMNDPNPNVVQTLLTERFKGSELPDDLESTLLKHWVQLSPATKWSVIRALKQVEKKWLLLEIDSWTRSHEKWLQFKGIASLGKTSGTKRRQKDDKRLAEYFERGTELQRMIAYSSSSELQKVWFKQMLLSKDPFTLATALDSISDLVESVPDKSTLALSESELSQIVSNISQEPQPQFYTLKPLEAILPAETYRTALERLLSSAHYQVRLKAAEALGLESNSPVFSAPWESGIPAEVQAMAATFLSNPKPKYWHIQTEKGTVLIELATDMAPVTTASIMHLANSKFFHGMPIHRVVPDFVVQAGDSRGDGSGGPGYAIPCEINPLKLNRGAVGMALAGKDTGGSQFFICHSTQPHLDGGYTVFGHVVRGMSVVDVLEEGNLILNTSIIDNLKNN